MKWITGAISLTLAAAAAGCGGEPGRLPSHGEPVDVAVSRSAVSYGLASVPGTVVATEEAALATRVSGTIRRVPVDIGARVSEGQLLVSLDSNGIDARISSAEAAAQLARQWHARISALEVDGAATAQELDDASARLEMAEAALRDARAQRDYVVLRAPFSGVITARAADPGDLAAPGVPILMMIGTASVKIEADLPAEMAGKLSVGDRVGISYAETGERFAARVTRIVPAVERASRRFRIEARFESDSAGPPSIPPGTFVRVELDERTATTRWIPEDAVVTHGQLNGVFVVEDEQLRLRWIRLGQQVGETVEILAGPGAQALFVREPSPTLTDGQSIGSVRRVDWTPPFVTELTASMEGVR